MPARSNAGRMHFFRMLSGLSGRRAGLPPLHSGGRPTRHPWSFLKHVSVIRAPMAASILASAGKVLRCTLYSRLAAQHPCFEIWCTETPDRALAFAAGVRENVPLPCPTPSTCADVGRRGTPRPARLLKTAVLLLDDPFASLPFSPVISPGGFRASANDGSALFARLRNRLTVQWCYQTCGAFFCSSATKRLWT